MTGKAAMTSLSDSNAQWHTSEPITVAALYVEKDGIYSKADGVDLWPESRDARKYAGPWPVVAHPPCQRWGDQWHGCRPVGDPKRGRLGDDKGCFCMALYAVETFGGVLEHPADSQAFAAFGLPAPLKRGWQRGWKGWTALVDQGHFGHPAQKWTWLYVMGTAPPILPWGPSGKGPLTGSIWDRGCGDRARTPPAFRDLLLSIAASARKAGR